MKIRKQSYGNKNIIGKRVETLRKAADISQKDFVARLQTMGLDINPTSYSKLEGQIRSATDREVYFIAKALGISADDLFDEFVCSK